MAVAFTTYLGLAKPTESELAQDWGANQKWAAKNNILVGNGGNFPFQSYTPTMIGSLTNPNLGSAGAALGEYCEFQGFVFGNFDITFSGSGVSVGTGSGAYGIKLPTAVDTTFHSVGSTLGDGPSTMSCIGEAYLYDASNINLSGTAVLDLIRLNGVDYTRLVTETYSGKSTWYVTPNIPAALVGGDSLQGTFVYKKG